MPEWVGNIAAGLFVAVVTSVVTVRLSIKRFRSERWWERKVEAYTDLLAALSDSKRYANLQARVRLTQSESNQAADRLEEQHRDAYDRLRRATTVGSFILSKDVAQRLEDLDSRLAGLEYDSGPTWEYFEMSAELYSNAISDIRAAAKSDLEVR